MPFVWTDPAKAGVQILGGDLKRRVGFRFLPEFFTKAIDLAREGTARLREEP